MNTEKGEILVFYIGLNSWCQCLWDFGQNLINQKNSATNWISLFLGNFWQISRIINWYLVLIKKKKMKRKKKSLKKLPMNGLDLHHWIKPGVNFAHADKSSFTIAIQKSLLEAKIMNLVMNLKSWHWCQCHPLLRHFLICRRHLAMASSKDSTCPKENHG